MARVLTVALSFHWFMFWLLNGLDKILLNTDLGLFTWGGKDRTQQFSGYLDKLGWSREMFDVLMMALMVVEIAIAATFAYAIVQVVKHRSRKHFMPQYALKLPILLSMLCFTCFSVWDVIVGDRAELWEHGTFIIGLGVTWVIASFEGVLDVGPNADFDGPERRDRNLADRRN